MKQSKKESAFIQVCNEMSSSGYEKKSFVISEAKVLILGTVIALMPVVFLFVLYRMIYGLQPDFSIDYPVFIIQLLASLIAHEFLHGLGWMIGGNCKGAQIAFGISSLFPYCYCKKPLSAKQYLIGAIFPFVILGVGISILAVVFENLSILILAVMNLVLCGGDLIIVFHLRKITKGSFVIDHPYKAGFVAFEKNTV